MKKRRWEDFTFEHRRELLGLLRDHLQSLVPLLWEAHEKKPLADWRECMAGAVARLNEWDDLDFETVPFALKEIGLTIEQLELFIEDAAALSASKRREWVRRLLGDIEGRCGVASGEWWGLMELELLALSSRREVASAKRQLAEARAELAAVRGDLEEKRRQDKAAQDAQAEQSRVLQLLEEIRQRVQGVPALVHNAEVAMDTPLQMAREIREVASSELSRDALALFFELENGLSVNAAAKKLKIPRQTLDRRLHDEIEPFRKRHNLPAPGKGKHRTIPFPSNK